jgi:peptidyl-tRNA hydrolase
VREDLSPGQQAVQAGHAAIDFQHQHPNISKEWWTHSNYLVYLAVKDEHELSKILHKAQSQQVATTAFIEPDLNNSLTAAALEPCEVTRRLTSSLPLAFKSIK